LKNNIGVSSRDEQQMPVDDRETDHRQNWSWALFTQPPGAVSQNLTTSTGCGQGAQGIGEKRQTYRRMDA